MEGLLLLATLAWGLSFIWIKQVDLSGMNPNLFIAIRYAIAVAAMTPFCLKELRRISRRELGYGLLIGALMYLAMAFQTYGMAYTTPANSAFITTAYVIFVPFTSWLVLKKRPKMGVYLSVILCLAGLYVLTLGPGQVLEANLGNLLTMVCAISWSFQVAVLTKAGRQCGIKVLTLVPLMVMLVISLGVTAATGGFTLAGVDVKAAMIPTVLCALFPTLLAGVAQTYAQRHIEPSKAAVIYTLESVFACVISVLMGLEKMTATLALGGGLILAAMALGEVLERRQAKKEGTA